MNQLAIASALKIPSSTAHLLPSLNLELCPGDGMYQGNDSHYLSCGASALNVIMSALRIIGASDPTAILDFGAGAGRVTRWLRAAYPQALIHACDLRERDLEFCRSAFKAQTWVSGVQIDKLERLSLYDLIWLGSVITHLPPQQSIAMISKILSWTNIGGLLIFSSHGRRALKRQSNEGFRYIHDSGWQQIVADFQRVGYGYCDYEGQTGYGISVIKLSWLALHIEERTDCKLILLSETAWDDHHDVVALQRIL